MHNDAIEQIRAERFSANGVVRILLGGLLNAEGGGLQTVGEHVVNTAGMDVVSTLYHCAKCHGDSRVGNVCGRIERTRKRRLLIVGDVHAAPNGTTEIDQ